VDKDPAGVPFVYAYVSFRSMKGFEIVAESYNEFNNPVKRNRIKYLNKLLSCLPCGCNCF
jgi:hypothetical protein